MNLKLSPKQLSVLTNAENYQSHTVAELAKMLNLSRITIGRWRSKITGQGSSRRKEKETSPARDALLKLVKHQLENNPEYLAYCVQRLDWKKLIGV